MEGGEANGGFVGTNARNYSVDDEKWEAESVGERAAVLVCAGVDVGVDEGVEDVAVCPFGNS